MLCYVGATVLVVLSIYCWLGIKSAYGAGKVLPFRVSAAIWILDTLHLILVIFASLNNVWEMHFNYTFAFITGRILISIGLTILLIGMIQFHSLRRISGMQSSGLITAGIYRWSRNPQYVGWFICLFGVSITGRSGLALLLTVALIIGIHLYNIWLEEPYLERILGNEYLEYKSRTARYVGIPRKSNNIIN
jgi:protein-S-isoprenylcysteine O-methyltransferase Ste14